LVICWLPFQSIYRDGILPEISFAARFSDRLGAGTRSAPRDALSHLQLLKSTGEKLLA